MTHLSRRIEPFRALLYNQARVTNLREVVAPPYDLIRADRQNELYDRSPYNIVRLELGRETDRYAASAATLAMWRADATLPVGAASRRPSRYTQSFEVGGHRAQTPLMDSSRVCGSKISLLGESFRMRKHFRPPRQIASSF